MNARDGSHKAVIRRDLMKGKKLSALSALRDYGCMRLAARVCELRNEGMKIESTRRKSKKGGDYFVYSLEVPYDE